MEKNMIGLVIFAALFLNVQGAEYADYDSSKPFVSEAVNSIIVPKSDETIILTHIIFRHGNRTPDLNELYPTDPYLNEPYYPFGNGQLTKAGKQKELNVGRYLRKRYESLLGPIYYPEVIDAFSTDYDRTKASLKLVLAGLFPPRAEDLSRLPIVPFNYLPRNRDKVLLGVLCPKYMEMYEDACRSPEYQAEYSKYMNAVAHIVANTELNFSRFLDGYNLYFGLKTEEEWGFILPTWSTQENIWPDNITSMAIQEYFAAMHTPEMRQMATGYFLQKIIEDTKAKILSSNQAGKKMYLYSAHENNLAELLMSLNLFKNPHVPNYGAWIAIEVHYVDDVVGVKVYYDNHVGNGPQLLFIPNCGPFCPLDKFIALTESLIPSEELCGI